MLAVFHVVRAAFLRAPVTDVRAQRTELLGEWAVTGDRICAQSADRRAVNAARGAGVGAGRTGHVRETVTTRGRALVTRGDAVLGVLVEMITHRLSPMMSTEIDGISECAADRDCASLLLLHPHDGNDQEDNEQYANDGRESVSTHPSVHAVRHGTLRERPVPSACRCIAGALSALWNVHRRHGGCNRPKERDGA